MRSFAAAALFLGTTLAVKVADTKGLSFIDTSNNQRLQIIGVEYVKYHQNHNYWTSCLSNCSYQPGGQAAFNSNTGQDVLSDGNACLRDAVIMQQLGVSGMIDERTS